MGIGSLDAVSTVNLEDLRLQAIIEVPHRNEIFIDGVADRSHRIKGDG